MSLIITAWFVVLSWLRTNGTNIGKPEIIIDKDLGIVLQGRGVMNAGNEAAYVSAFVKIPNPTYEGDLCQLICGPESELLDIWTMSDRCRHGDGRAGRESTRDTVMSSVELKKDAGKRDQIKICTLKCLQQQECRAIQIYNNNCILRRRELRPDEIVEQEGSLEKGMACIISPENRTEACKLLHNEDNLNVLMREADKAFVNKHWGVVNDMVRQVRRKRSVAGAVTGGIIGLLATGYSFYETHKVKKHISKLEASYEDFKNNQARFNHEQVDFNEGLLKIFKGWNNRLSGQLEQLKCRQDNLGYYILNNRRLLDWKDSLYQVYRDVVAGNMVGPISTTIFNHSNMIKIIKGTELLQNSIYLNDLTAAYRLGTMFVADASMTDERFNVHMVLKIPIIKEGSLKMVFDVLQTGTEYEGMCIKFVLPDTVYEMDGAYFNLEGTTCEVISNLKLCRGSVNTTRVEMPCITNKNICPQETEKCETAMIQTTTGLLVRTQEEIQVSYKNETFPKELKQIRKSENGVSFLNYTHVGDVLVGKLWIRGLSSSTINNYIELSNTKAWLDELKNETKRRSQISRNVNTTRLEGLIHDQRIILERLKTSEQHNHMSIIGWGVLAGIPVVGLIAWIIWKYGKQMKNAILIRLTSSTEIREAVEQREKTYIQVELETLEPREAVEDGSVVTY